MVTKTKPFIRNFASGLFLQWNLSEELAYKEAPAPEDQYRLFSLISAW